MKSAPNNLEQPKQLKVLLYHLINDIILYTASLENNARYLSKSYKPCLNAQELNSLNRTIFSDGNVTTPQVSLSHHRLGTMLSIQKGSPQRKSPLSKSSQVRSAEKHKKPNSTPANNLVKTLSTIKSQGGNGPEFFTPWSRYMQALRHGESYGKLDAKNSFHLFVTIIGFWRMN